MKGKGVILPGMAPPSVAEALGLGRDSDGDKEREERGRGDSKDSNSVDGKYST